MPQKKPLLELKNIGKIYVSEGNVSVGIRGVDLTFDAGEFVAVTGMSGSGKSTLLNVISGMDTYEEGELFVDGEPTSHYIQKDWEAYRKEYISFIFQDYNIIESFTVLQNVELALLAIEDPRERRKKALELLRRVGLEKHIHHKGSKLSGGQKQRTVIARALAKDSPIILADEPTGNLDSQSSKEIIDLLREVSRDKLVIVVTHNFDEVEACATRHVRIHDGAVEIDHAIRSPEPVSENMAPAAPPPSRFVQAKRTLSGGLLLGRTRFRAMPKLSAFLCCLMTLTSLVFTLMTAANYDSTALFEKPRMFTHIDGRTVIVRQDGAIITDAELETLAQEMGARDYMHYDYFLDRTIGVTLGSGLMYEMYNFAFGYPEEPIVPDAGRLPEAPDEILFEVPISVKRHLGGDTFVETELPMLFDMATYRVVGVRYYYDNTRTPRMIFTEEGYRIASAIAFFSEQRHNFRYELHYIDPVTGMENIIGTEGDTFVDFRLPAGSYYLNYFDIQNLTDANGDSIAPADAHVSATMVGNFYKPVISNGGMFEEIVYDGYYDSSTEKAIYHDLSGFRLMDALPADSESDIQIYYGDWMGGSSMYTSDYTVLSPDIFSEFMYEHYYTRNYTQASLFFENDRAAHDAVEALRDRGYVAVVSDETASNADAQLLFARLGYIFDLLGWSITVIFATAFLSLCSKRAMDATRGDIAIMRSMGIPTGVVRVSIHVQTLIALIPAALVTAVVCVFIYVNPATNYIFTFLHARDYLIIALVLVIVAMNLSRKQAARMFEESVKKTLKGGKKS